MSDKRITIESITTKLGFNPLIETPWGDNPHENDRNPNILEKLSLEELDFLWEESMKVGPLSKRSKTSI